MNHATGGTTLGACRRGRGATTPIAGHGQHSAADARIAAVLIASLDRLGRFQRRAEVGDLRSQFLIAYLLPLADC